MGSYSLVTDSSHARRCVAKSKCPYPHPSLPWVPSPTAPYQLKRAAGPIPVPSAMTLGSDIADGQWLAPDVCADFPQTDGQARVHLVRQHDETPPATSLHIRCLLLPPSTPTLAFNGARSRSFLNFTPFVCKGHRKKKLLT